MTQDDFSKPYQQAGALAALHDKLCILLPIWNALSTARTVLDADMPMADDAEHIQRQLRALLQEGELAAERLSLRDGKELSSADADGYAGYVKNAIRACEEEDEQ